MRVAYVGNVGPRSAPHSTENHVAAALRANGADVVPIHEDGFGWRPEAVPIGVDLVLWTHTHGYAPEATHGRQKRFLDTMRSAGVPVVSYHLDRWWDLARQHQVADEPFFRTDLVCTADGGNDDRWAAAGVAHAWFPPGVSAAECTPGTYRPELASDVAFVGSWQGGYHPEHEHRAELVAWLRAVYGDRCRFWPAPGQPAVRGDALRDLYASAKVLVGDSCFAGDARGARYWSDRIPETLGRGGYLLHPHVDGLTDAGYRPGEHLDTWQAGDWDALDTAIDRALACDEHRRQVAAAGREHVLAHHTYEVRMLQLIDFLAEVGLLRARPVGAMP